MIDEELNASGESPVGNEQYIAAINELKDKTVSKESYEKLKQENKQLLESLINGTGVQVAGTPVEKVAIEELEERLMKGGLTNLDYIKTALELRERILEEEGRDTFVPVGTQYSPSAEDYAAAQRVAEGLQAMVDEANGSPEVFNGLYQSQIVDVVVPKKIKR